MALNFSKQLKGIVTRKSGINTYRVTINERWAHPIYKKIVTSQKSFLAHSEENHEIGEEVYIVPVTKISKRKYYRIIEQTKITAK
jgi:ribosomal protein S17